ncbi:hypothetical protein ZIOFF_017286 [Zingiber officinale]|uniref:Squalene monooxygenase n=1 Tax=Zingiber officinale TaxID=94328 RepID=A0A8J5HJC6_ZINOF|nr:hypothetical protein ZIOFF_017286 [Zingiber officinale]
MEEIEGQAIRNTSLTLQELELIQQVKEYDFNHRRHLEGGKHNYWIEKLLVIQETRREFWRASNALREEEITKEFEERNIELKAKALEIYQASDADIKNGLEDIQISDEQDGRRVHGIERDLSEPDRRAGESLHPGGYLKLLELGLEDCVDEIDAQRVIGYTLFKDRKSTRLAYPLEKHHEDVAGRSFRNGRFVQRMREKAISLNNVQLEQGTVTSLIEENGTVEGVVYKTNSGEEQREAFAPLTIVCDGAFSNLRRTLYSPKIPSIATGEMSNFLKTAMAPQVPTELHDPFIEVIDKGSFRSVPNKSMSTAPHPTPGALLLGDAFNMRHPLSGGGMMVALSDIVVLRDLLRPIPDLHHAASLCKYLESFYTLRKVVKDSYFNMLVIVILLHVLKDRVFFCSR